jgi:3-hydroxyisobutyrate dehydrogenase-like beta-hydroxyacid dehydrogenase
VPQGRSIVGFIGLGAIGSPIAERLIRGGEDLVVHNRTAAKAIPFRTGARIAPYPVVAADEADIVFACLTTEEAYREVVLGPYGIIHGKRAKTYVHIGTNAVSTVEALAQALHARGIATVDAPMTGGVSRAANGTLTVMAAGSRDAFAQAEPLIKHYANTIVYLGDRIGAAQVMKLVNNMISAGNLALACEGMVLGCKFGLDPVAMLEIINKGSGQSDASLTKIPEEILTRRFGYGANLGPAVQNMNAFAATAKNLDVPIPLADAITTMLKKAVAEEGYAADVTRVICLMEQIAGVTVAEVSPRSTVAK